MATPTTAKSKKVRKVVDIHLLVSPGRTTATWKRSTDLPAIAPNFSTTKTITTPTLSIQRGDGARLRIQLIVNRIAEAVGGIDWRWSGLLSGPGIARHRGSCSIECLNSTGAVELVLSRTRGLNFVKYPISCNCILSVQYHLSQNKPVASLCIQSPEPQDQFSDKDPRILCTVIQFVHIAPSSLASRLVVGTWRLEPIEGSTSVPCIFQSWRQNQWRVHD